MKPWICPILLFTILFSLFLAGNVPRVYSTPAYLPGVNVGDTAQYSVTTSWYNTFPNVPVPELIAQIQGATGISLQITGVTADIVTATSVWTFNNGTAARTEHLQGSVADGSGNITLLVIAGGLSPGDKIVNIPVAPAINYTSVANYAGSLRSINTFNYTFSLGFVSSSLATHWERYSGLATELSFTVNAYLSVGGYTYSERGLSDIKMTQTNITHAPPDFTISGNPSLTIQAQSKGAVTLTFQSQNGFAGKILLTAQTPSGASATFYPSQVIVPVDGSASTSLNITSTTAATYTVTVTATLQGQPVSHTKTETFTVTALTQPAATLFGLQPTLFYALVGAAAVILLLGAILVLRRSGQPPTPPEVPSSTPPLQPPPPTEQPPVSQPPAEQPKSPAPS